MRYCATQVLQLSLLVILESAAALSSFIHPNHVLLIPDWGSVLDGFAATPIIESKNT
jgi:hypothetical protein